ncbi:MAG: twin-arginine translocation signal domain-containing protein, partial [Bacteroidota bacterium]
MNNSRRNFLRYSTLAGLGLSLHPLSSFSFGSEKINNQPGFYTENLTEGQQLITLLQTTDVHCQ